MEGPKAKERPNIRLPQFYGQIDLPESENNRETILLRSRIMAPVHWGSEVTVKQRHPNVGNSLFRTSVCSSVIRCTLCCSRAMYPSLGHPGTTKTYHPETGLVVEYVEGCPDRAQKKKKEMRDRGFTAQLHITSIISCHHVGQLTCLGFGVCT